MYVTIGRPRDTARRYVCERGRRTGSTRTARGVGVLAADRYRTVVDVYVLLQRPDGMILLLERSGTGYADGQLCPPSGHLEAGESVVQGATREAREETGVLIDPSDLAFRHAIHYRSPDGQARVGFFFTAAEWQGEPVNRRTAKMRGAGVGRSSTSAGEYGAVHHGGAGGHHSRRLVLRGWLAIRDARRP